MGLIELFCNIAPLTRTAVPMLPQSLIFLDLETTGMTATHERITEIGLVEVARVGRSAKRQAGYSKIKLKIVARRRGSSSNQRTGVISVLI